MHFWQWAGVAKSFSCILRRFSRACFSDISWSLKYSTIFTTSGGLRSFCELYIPKVSTWMALAASARFQSQNRNIKSTAKKILFIIFDCALWSFGLTVILLWRWLDWHVHWNDKKRQSQMIKISWSSQKKFFIAQLTFVSRAQPSHGIFFFNPNRTADDSKDKTQSTKPININYFYFAHCKHSQFPGEAT